YFIAKNRIDLKPETDVDAILAKVKEMYGKQPDVQVTDIDGVKLDFPTKWVHLRKSNTEPIIRIYTEAATKAEADALAQEMIKEVMSLL
ncbi:MAG TPA: phosphoglucosamine mutase, partial [Prevotellaceae bacterium]|nr:phosphoglucosamine mutase [Prevotellaceae bacterium]